MSNKEESIEPKKGLKDILDDMPEALMYGSPETTFNPRRGFSNGLMYGPPERDFREIEDYLPDVEKDDK